MKKGGQKRKVSVEKMVKMMFEYYRQYRAYYQIVNPKGLRILKRVSICGLDF
jgi:hypothetical protein